MSSWFSVDKEGLRKLIDARGKAPVIFELVQNAWDTDATTVRVSLEKLPGRPYAKLVVEDDDPNGFHDLAHAYTLFAESRKKGDPTKRGRFNLGEKLVLALCRSAEVRSTSGRVRFLPDHTMKRSAAGKTEAGSVFEAEIRMTQPEFEEVCRDMERLIPPAHVETYFNGERLHGPPRLQTRGFEAILPTMGVNEDGVLIRTKRKTQVSLYITGGEPGWLYEMGIPVVETGDKYHVDVAQKVPLNLDRDNVPPSYLRQLRAHVLNQTSDLLDQEAAAETWVTDALSSPAVTDQAVRTAIERRFGTKRASYDPSDREANMNLTAAGYTVVTGASLPSAVWSNVRRAEAIRPAGRIRPTPKPFSDDPEAPAMKEIPPTEWSPGMTEVAEIVSWFAGALGISSALRVVYGDFGTNRYIAAWSGPATFIWNVRGKQWLETWYEHPHEIFDTMIHEFAHSRASNHLDEKFHQACTEFGAKVVMACVLRSREIPHMQRVVQHHVLSALRDDTAGHSVARETQ